MGKYVFAYHGGGDMPESEADQAALMEAWGAWFAGMGEAVIDGGNPTSMAVTVGADESVTPGGGSNPLTGYSLVQAASLEAAAELAKGCPVLASGGSVEVAEIVEM